MEKRYLMVILVIAFAYGITFFNERHSTGAAVDQSDDSTFTESITSDEGDVVLPPDTDVQTQGYTEDNTPYAQPQETERYSYEGNLIQQVEQALSSGLTDVGNSGLSAVAFANAVNGQISAPSATVADIGTAFLHKTNLNLQQSSNLAKAFVNAVKNKK